MENIIQVLAEYIKKSRYTVALTGAGISTSAGIPDFRGEKGIYITRQYDPEKTFDINAFKKDPSSFYAFTRDYFTQSDSLKPTPAHRLLARLEEKKLLQCVMTQNIDGLHHTAGSHNVIELHGSYRTGRCLSCGTIRDLNWIRDRIRSSGTLDCPCGGITKPDIVFFGEPVLALEKSYREALKADLFLVMGSSLTVYPAALLPEITRGKTVIINKGPADFPTSKTALRLDKELDAVSLELASLLNIAL
ncbi:MAG TPA: RNA polymerase subunit sigma [Firmicutes bacterium]|nr:RNA polymerase subunit sigma [Bacillota bacterium]